MSNWIPLLLKIRIIINDEYEYQKSLVALFYKRKRKIYVTRYVIMWFADETEKKMTQKILSKNCKTLIKLFVYNSNRREALEATSTQSACSVQNLHLVTKQRKCHRANQAIDRSKFNHVSNIYVPISHFPFAHLYVKYLRGWALIDWLLKVLLDDRVKSSCFIRSVYL